MGWLDLVLGAASASAGMYNASQLETLRRQGAEAALIQAIIQYLREQIFEFKQMAESALTFEAQSAKLAAGAISVVELRLLSSGITPDLFQELGDKEYTKNMVRLIGDNKRRLLAMLSTDEQSEVGRVAAAAARLPDYNYYVDNFDVGRRLMEAASAVAEYEARNGCMFNTAVSLGYFFVGLPVAIVMFGVSIGWNVGVTVGFGLWLAGLVGIILWQHAGEYKAAKKTMEELKDKVNLPRFMALDQQLGGRKHAEQLQQAAQALVMPFFGDARLLNA